MYLGATYNPLSDVVKKKADALKRNLKDDKYFRNICKNSFKRGAFISRFNEANKDCQINYSDIWSDLNDENKEVPIETNRQFRTVYQTRCTKPHKFNEEFLLGGNPIMKKRKSSKTKSKKSKKSKTIKSKH